MFIDEAVRAIDFPCWPGEAGKPLTREQRLAKFFSCTRPVLAEGTAVRILDLVERLDMLPDVAEILDLARACHAQPDAS